MKIEAIVMPLVGKYVEEGKLARARDLITEEEEEERENQDKRRKKS